MLKSYRLKTIFSRRVFSSLIADQAASALVCGLSGCGSFANRSCHFAEAPFNLDFVGVAFDCGVR